MELRRGGGPHLIRPALRAGNRNSLARSRALRRVPICRCLFVKGGREPPSHTLPPVTRAANRVRCREFFARSEKTTPDGTVRKDNATPDRRDDAQARERRPPVGTRVERIKWGTHGAISCNAMALRRVGVPHLIRPALRAGNRNSLARLRRAAASSDWELPFCERGAGAPLSHSPPGHAGSEQSSLP